MKGKIGYLVHRWPGSDDPEDYPIELEFKTEEEFNNSYYYKDEVTRIVYFEVEYDDEST